MRFPSHGPRSRRARRSGERGFSLVETSVFLGTAAILASTLATVGFQSMETARRVVAREDVEAIAAALGQLMIDNGNLRLSGPGDEAVELLATAGGIPDGPVGALTRPIDDRSVVELFDVLYDNAIGLPEPVSVWEPGWRGPYLQPSRSADPWGHRYAVALPSDREPALFVLSAGPDGRLQSSRTGAAPRIEGDDVLFLLAVTR